MQVGVERAMLFDVLGLSGAWGQVTSAPAVYRVGAAAVVTVVFTGVARWVRGVTISGAFAGAVVSFLLYVSAGPGAFVALVSVFVLAVATTRLGYSRKQKLGTAEKSDGRSASQIAANLGVATLAALGFALGKSSLFLLGCAAALAEAAADTVSSEYGQAKSERARLITSWEIVPAGTDGGISAAGTIAGSIAAVIVGCVCVLVRLVSWESGFVASCAAILGMLLDSGLGASLERRGVLNNDQVNFLSTVAAALMAILVRRITL